MMQTSHTDRGLAIQSFWMGGFELSCGSGFGRCSQAAAIAAVGNPFRAGVRGVGGNIYGGE
jgi:hypothetical protein